jgi:hypothetical protein
MRDKLIELVVKGKNERRGNGNMEESQDLRRLWQVKTTQMA